MPPVCRGISGIAWARRYHHAASDCQSQETLRIPCRFPGRGARENPHGRVENITGCPFCEPTDDHRLSVVAVDGEGGLRIDYCERCRGYLKTYNGAGSENLLLADWTSLHLDVLARDRGLTRMAASLYEL